MLTEIWQTMAKLLGIRLPLTRGFRGITKRKFQPPQKREFESKIPIFLVALCCAMGIFGSKRPGFCVSETFFSRFWVTHPRFGHGLNTVSEFTVQITKHSEFSGPYQATGDELSEFLSSYYVLGWLKGVFA